MGLFDRVSRVIRSNINSVVSAAEDPEKILNQTINDMKEDQVQLRQAVVQAIASQKQMEQKYRQAQQAVEQWQRRAELAMRNGDENLAREALVRKKSEAEAAQGMKQQLDQQTTQVNALKENLTKLESKIAEAKTKKDMLIARARSAKASEQINQVVGRLSNTSSFEAFDRMQDKVESLEARAQATTQLTSDSLESQFAALEASGSDVDSELALLKASVQGSLPSGETKALGQGSESSASSEVSDLDQELEQLRSQTGSSQSS